MNYKELVKTAYADIKEAERTKEHLNSAERALAEKDKTISYLYKRIEVVKEKALEFEIGKNYLFYARANYAKAIKKLKKKLKEKNKKIKEMEAKGINELAEKVFDLKRRNADLRQLAESAKSLAEVQREKIDELKKENKILKARIESMGV